MKKVCILVMFSFFIIVGNVAAADISGRWIGTIECCSDNPNNIESEDVDVIITQNGDFFITYNDEKSETCSGVLDGNKLSISCPPSGTGEVNSSFSYGEVKGNTIYVINHVPHEAKTCKATIYKYKEE